MKCFTYVRGILLIPLLREHVSHENIVLCNVGAVWKSFFILQMTSAHVSCVDSLKYLCLLSLEDTGARELEIDERVVLFKEAKKLKRLGQRILRVLSVGDSSCHFLSRYGEADFSEQPIDDSCIQMIYSMLPSTTEVDQASGNSFSLNLDLSKCLQLIDPTIEINETRGKLSVPTVSLSGCKYLENLQIVLKLCCPSSLRFINLSHCRSISSYQVREAT